jgi:hypothetical protein
MIRIHDVEEVLGITETAAEGVLVLERNGMYLCFDWRALYGRVTWRRFPN